MIMLVLSRKKNDSIVIADNIVITILDVRGDRVRLGIEAPKTVPIYRQEIYEWMKDHQQIEDQAQGG